VSAEPAYSELVARLFAEAPGAGAPAGPGWAAGEASEPLTGTAVRFFLRAEAGRVAEARYLVRGCPHTIAGAALASRGLPGRAVAGLDVDAAALAAELGAPPEKLGRIFVIQDAIRSAALQLARPPA
jgi:NifU-like protein involved in Fe-S cluster formation